MHIKRSKGYFSTLQRKEKERKVNVMYVVELDTK
jgi:hypothetical protein